MMKICGFVQCYNEESKGNLRRCLNNLQKYCDVIAVYDDGSTDDSIKVIKEYTDLILEGKENDFLNETTHKQQLLNLIEKEEPGIDWYFWLDCDEVLDRNGTKELRKFCESASADGYWFPEITLWRSESWARKDYLGQGKFLRLWRNNGNLKFWLGKGLHLNLFPQGLHKQSIAPFNVIHYGYSTYEFIVNRWKERTKHGVPVEIRKKCLDESALVLEHVSDDLFPEGCEPKNCEKPRPIKYEI